MSSRLEQAAAEVASFMSPLVLPFVLPAVLAPAALITFVGKVKEAHHGKPPRIVWVPRREAIRPASQQHSAAQRTLRDREALVDVHLWGADLEQAENMFHEFVAIATDRFSHIAIDVDDSEWWGDDKLSRGMMLVVPVRIRFPVIRTTYASVTVQTVDLVAKMRPTPDGTLEDA